MGGGGKPVWVDGIRYESSVEACLKHGFSLNSFKVGIKKGQFKGHVLSRYPPSEVKEERYECLGEPEADFPVKRRSDSLLKGEYCVHRLGVFKN